MLREDAEFGSSCSREEISKMLLSRGKIILLHVKNRDSHPQMLSLCQLARAPSVHICHNWFQFNAMAHFSSVAVTLNGPAFLFTSSSSPGEKEK